MARQTERSLQLTEEGMKEANTAFEKLAITKSELATQISVSRTKVKGASSKTTVGISRGTINNFFKGEPVQYPQFKEICKALGLDWQKVSSRAKQAEIESLRDRQESSADIDALVREVRARAYADVKNRTGTMLMLRVNHPVPVADIYVDLNILQRVSGDFSFSDWRREFQGDWRSFDRLGLGRTEQERVPAIEKIRDCCKLMVLGKPGAGKSTLLKALATKCIDDKLGWDELEYVPVFITLWKFAEDATTKEEFSLRDAIEQQFRRWGVADSVEPILQKGRALILLDGLDEVPADQSKFVIRQMRHFCQDYSDNRFIISCRTQSLKTHFEGFTEVEIADFNQEQVEHFIKNWFAVVVDNEELAEQLIQQLQANKPIADLAVTPILLNLTCAVFWDERGKLPTKRVDLYRKGLQDLLKKWDTFRGIQRNDGCRPLTLDEKEDLLAQIAYKLFEENDYFPEQGKLVRLIANHLQIQRSEAEQILRSLEAQHGLIIERSEGYFSFSHLTFQEYFAAKYIVDSSTPKAALQNLVNHVTEPRWREVFLLTVEMLNSTEDLLRLMKEKIYSLLKGELKIQEFLAWLEGKSQEDTNGFYKYVAIRAFYYALAQSNSPGYFFKINTDKTPAASPFDIDLALVTALSFAQSLSLIQDIYLAFKGDFDSYRSLASHLGFQPGFKVGLATALTTLEERENNAAKSIERSLNRVLGYSSELQPQLKQSLKKCLEELHTFDLVPNLAHPSEDNSKIEWRRKWWKDNGKDWTESLRAMIIEYRNIGHDWQFSDAQKERLQQYYDANKILVDCLNSSSCNIDKKLRQEIEDTLLLPIEEIEKRKQLNR